MAKLKMGKRRAAVKPIEPSPYLRCMFISKARTFASCHRLYYWTYVRNMVPKAIRMPFWVGDVYHKGVELFFDGMKEKDILRRIREYMKKTLAKTYVPPESMPYIEINKVVIQGMLRAFFHVMAPKAKSWKIIATELPFSVNLETDNYMLVPFVGRVDLVYEDGKHLGVAEWKTASQINKDYFDRIPFNLQAMCYPVAVQQALGRKVSRIFYSVVRKPSISQRKNETFKQFLERMVADYIDRQDWYFHSQTILYNQKHVNAAMSDLVRITEEIWTYHDALEAEGVLNKDEWYRNSEYCFTWGRCPYYYLCRYGERHDTMKLFVKRETRYVEEESEKESSGGKKPVKRKKKSKAKAK